MGAASRGVRSASSGLLGSLLGDRLVGGSSTTLGDSLGLGDGLGDGFGGSLGGSGLSGGLGLELVGAGLVARGLLGGLGGLGGLLGFLGLALGLGGVAAASSAAFWRAAFSAASLLAHLRGGVAELVGEALDASTGVDELLLAGVERVALASTVRRAAPGLVERVMNLLPHEQWTLRLHVLRVDSLLHSSTPPMMAWFPTRPEDSPRSVAPLGGVGNDRLVRQCGNSLPRYRDYPPQRR